MFTLIGRSLFFISIFLLGLSCSSPTNVADTGENIASYSPLRVGIIKQSFSFADSTYQTSKILGRAFREDGQEVYISEITSSSKHITDIRTYGYQFIKNGYLYSTLLVKGDLKLNPYHEVRIAKEFPDNGDSWILNPSAIDSNKILFTAFYIGQMTTPAGVFQDVFKYKFYDDTKLDTSTVYYAKGIGSIGSLSKYGLVLVNYVKIEDKEYGKLEPQGFLQR